MSAFIYYLVLPFVYLLSVMPFFLLYLLSDVCYFFIYYIAGYRKKVVLANLRNAFPDESEAGINRLCRQFFRYLCSLLLETFKTLTIPEKKMIRHCRLHPAAQTLFDSLAAEKRSIILAMGHQGNWEWAGNTFSILCHQQLYVIYHPLSNRHFDGLVHRMRTRFKTKLIPMKNTYRDMAGNSAEVNATAFIADQTPSAQNAYWTSFLHQDTPVFQGMEKIARKMNRPIVYAQVKRIKRGYYEIGAEMLVEQPAAMPEGAISECYIRRLEKDIIAQPETWLWSHRRWKHKRIPASSNQQPCYKAKS